MFPKVVCTPLTNQPAETSIRTLVLGWAALWSQIKQHPREEQRPLKLAVLS